MGGFAPLVAVTSDRMDHLANATLNPNSTDVDVIAVAAYFMFDVYVQDNYTAFPVSDLLNWTEASIESENRIAIRDHHTLATTERKSAV